MRWTSRAIWAALAPGPSRAEAIDHSVSPAWTVWVCRCGLRSVTPLRPMASHRFLARAGTRPAGSGPVPPAGGRALEAGIASSLALRPARADAGPARPAFVAPGRFGRPDCPRARPGWPGAVPRGPAPGESVAAAGGRTPASRRSVPVGDLSPPGRSRLRRPPGWRGRPATPTPANARRSDRLCRPDPASSPLSPLPDPRWGSLRCRPRSHSPAPPPGPSRWRARARQRAPGAPEPIPRSRVGRCDDVRRGRSSVDRVGDAAEALAAGEGVGDRVDDAAWARR